LFNVFTPTYNQLELMHMALPRNTQTSGDSGWARVLDYDLHCRTRACLLCTFVPPPTSLIEVANSGSLHYALSVFIYFRFMSGLRVHAAGDLDQKRSLIVGVLSTSFARALFGLIP